MMPTETQNNNECCGPDGTACANEALTELLPIYREAPLDEPCCGPPPGPASSPFEKPGYRLCDFVEGFTSTPAGSVPRIKTRPGIADLFGTIKVRLGINRSHY